MSQCHFSFDWPNACPLADGVLNDEGQMCYELANNCTGQMFQLKLYEDNGEVKAFEMKLLD